MLAPAVDLLLGSGKQVVVVARGPAAADGGSGLLTAVSLDWQDPGAVDARLTQLTRDRPLDAAIVYCPTAPTEVRDRFVAAVQGRVVLLLTSAAAQPPAPGADSVDLADLPPYPAVRVRRLLLGRQPAPQGARWHTPQEISQAAVEVLRTGHESTLGTIRPWAGRPPSS